MGDSDCFIQADLLQKYGLLTVQNCQHIKAHCEQGTNSEKADTAKFLNANFIALAGADLLTDENFQSFIMHDVSEAQKRSVISHRVSYYASGIDNQHLKAVHSILSERQSLSSNALATILWQKYSSDLMDAIKTMHERQLLSVVPLTDILSHADPYNLASAILVFAENGLPWQENLAAILSHVDPRGLAAAVRFFDRQLLIEGWLDVVLSCPGPHLLVDMMRKFESNELSFLRLFASLSLNTLSAMHNAFLNDINSCFWFLRAFRVVISRHLWSDEIAAAIASHSDPARLAVTLEMLDQYALLSHDNIVDILSHANIRLFGDVIRKIQTSEASFIRILLLLSLEQLNIIASHANPSGLVSAIGLFDRHGLPLHENLAAILSHAKPRGLVSAIEVFVQYGLPLQDNLAAILSHANPRGLVSAIEKFVEYHLSLSEHLTTILSHKYPLGIAFAVKVFAQNSLPLQENLATILSQAKPGLLAKAVKMLARHNLLSQVNVSMMLQHPHPHLFAACFVLDNQENPIIDDCLCCLRLIADVIDWKNAQSMSCFLVYTKDITLTYKMVSNIFSHDFAGHRDDQAKIDIILAMLLINHLGKSENPLLEPQVAEALRLLEGVVERQQSIDDNSVIEIALSLLYEIKVVHNIEQDPTAIRHFLHDNADYWLSVRGSRFFKSDPVSTSKDDDWCSNSCQSKLQQPLW